MGKATLHGSAPKDDPIYSGGVTMFTPQRFKRSTKTASDATVGTSPLSPERTSPEERTVGESDGADQQFIKISFFTVVMLASSLASAFREGVAGFDRRYPHAIKRLDLRALVFMSGGDLDEFLDELDALNLVVGRDLAVGEMRHGEWMASCPGIRFQNRGSPRFSPWVAVYDDRESGTNHKGTEPT